MATSSIADAGGSIRITGRDILFVHWPVEPEYVRPHLPDAFTTETFDETAWVTALAHEVTESRPDAVPFSVTRPFPQLNFRTYVTFDGDTGVYFLSLDTGDRLGAMLGRQVLRLPFYRADMRFSRHEDTNTITFQSRRITSNAPSARFDARYRPAGDSFQAEPGSIEAFLVERHQFFVPHQEHRKDTTARAGADDKSNREQRFYVGNITRDPWELYETDATIHTNSLFTALDMDTPAAAPLMHYSPRYESTTEQLQTVDAP